MTSDLETVPGVACAARRRLENGELVFSVKDVSTIIQSCKSCEIAVLGIEIFPGLNISIYDLRLKGPSREELWSEFVSGNNAQAQEFIKRQGEAKAESDCVLTTASWREFCEIAKRQT